MNSKERVHAALIRKPVDQNPVTVLYNFLYIRDHFHELTGEPQMDMQKWLYASPDDYLAIYRQIVEKVPFETLQPEWAPPRQIRENTEFIVKDGKHYRYNKKNGILTLLDTVSGFPVDYMANETQFVFDKKDINEKVRVIKAEQAIADGVNDYIEATVNALGKDHFILSGGVVGTIYSCSAYVGQTNSLAMLRTDADFIDYLCHKILEINIETIRQLAAAGGDGIYIDDATATNDMISVKDYERFSLPYMKAMVDEIHRLGQKAIVIYFGGIADRLDQIADTSADGLQFETSMKAYINDLDEIVQRIGNRMTIFGNIDPVGILEKAIDSELETEIRRQTLTGNKGRGFILCTGSPITPATPLSRVRLFIELGHKLGGR